MGDSPLETMLVHVDDSTLSAKDSDKSEFMITKEEILEFLFKNESDFILKFPSHVYDLISSFAEYAGLEN